MEFDNNEKLIQHFARERLTAKQKAIISFIITHKSSDPVTRVVQQLKKILGCSETAVWNNVAQLKRIGVVSYGDQQTKGQPLRTTPFGKLISKGLQLEE